MSTKTRPVADCISHSMLLRLLYYDEKTGDFTWKVRRSWRAPVGSKAGTTDVGKPIKICLLGASYQAHQLAWFYVHGEWAGCELDHKNGDHRCNVLLNLRKVSRNGNVQNMRKAQANNKKSGLLGAYKNDRGRWYARICTNRKSTYLGTFDTAEQAHNAYVAAKRELHSTCTI